MLQLIYRKFKFGIRNTTLKKELGGGLITFFTMIYILPVNASILSDNGTGIPYGGVLLATALVSALGSILVGTIANLPIGVAPGMGANVFFAGTMMNDFHLRWEVALAVVFISSLFVSILAFAGFVNNFITAIPLSIKHAFVVGLGVYLAYIGLKNGGIVVANGEGLGLGDLSQIPVILALGGIILVFILALFQVKMAIIYTLLIFAFIGLVLGQLIPNSKNLGLASFSDINFNYSQFNSFGNVFGKGMIAIPTAVTNYRIYPAVLAIVFMMLSGSSSTIISIGEIANLKDAQGNVEGSKQATIGFSLASLTSGILGSSTAGGFLESNAGAKYGARTGVAAIFIGMLFLISIPLFPFLQLLFKNNFVTTPALVFVGSMMIKNIKKINWNDFVISISSFILLIMMWFTASILNGLAFGLVAYVIFEVVRGNYQKVNLYTYIFGFLFLVYIITIPMLTNF